MEKLKDFTEVELKALADSIELSHEDVAEEELRTMLEGLLDLDEYAHVDYNSFHVSEEKSEDDQPAVSPGPAKHKITNARRTAKASSFGRR